MYLSHYQNLFSIKFRLELFRYSTCSLKRVCRTLGSARPRIAVSAGKLSAALALR
jgi:hypothetical protein